MLSVVLAATLTLVTLHPTTQSTSCTCATARLSNAWCAACKVGYVAGVPIPFADLHEVIDCHGHHIDPTVVQCDSCTKARAADGYCDSCGLGYINQQMYFSKLTYLVGRGRQSDPGGLDCPACRDNSRKYGWCDKCRVGRVGNVAHTDRGLFEQLCREYDFLLAALEAAKRCEWCACCMFTGATCPRCKIAYERGKLPPSPPTSRPAGQPDRSP